MNTKLKPIIAALGLGLAIASAPAAAVTLYGPITQFEDDNVDWVIKGAGNTLATTLQVGDTLVSILEIIQTVEVLGTGSAFVAPQELTGVGAITLAGFADLDGVGGANDMIFTPFAGGLNTYLGGKLVTGGGAGGGAMVAFFLDNTQNLITTGSTNCTSLADCITRATDGTLFEVDGFEGDTDEFWIALNAATDLAAVLAGPSTQGYGTFNFGLSILDDGGNSFLKDALTCTGATALFCGGDDKIDLIGQGTVLGGQGLTNGAIAHSDFDFQKAVPEPATLALLGLGLLGIGASLRKKVR